MQFCFASKFDFIRINKRPRQTVTVYAILNSVLSLARIWFMESNTKKILKKIENKSREVFLPIVGPEKGKFLQKIIEHYKPKNILEIGTSVGYSSILMSQYLCEGGKITTVEINQKSAVLARENIRMAGGQKLVEVVCGDAMKVIPKLKNTFDFLFLDAEKNEYYNYILLAEHKLAPNAIIVADNARIFEDEMRDYLDYVRNNEHFSSETYEFGDDAMEITFMRKNAA